MLPCGAGKLLVGVTAAAHTLDPTTKEQSTDGSGCAPGIIVLLCGAGKSLVGVQTLYPKLKPRAFLRPGIIVLPCGAGKSLVGIIP